jgi:hypothetical protein
VKQSTWAHTRNGDAPNVNGSSERQRAIRSWLQWSGSGE